MKRRAAQMPPFQPQFPQVTNPWTFTTVAPQFGHAVAAVVSFAFIVTMYETVSTIFNLVYVNRRT